MILTDITAAWKQIRLEQEQSEVRDAAAAMRAAHPNGHPRHGYYDGLAYWLLLDLRWYGRPSPWALDVARLWHKGGAA